MSDTPDVKMVGEVHAGLRENAMSRFSDAYRVGCAAGRALVASKQ
jgi:hypothetical protein